MKRKKKRGTKGLIFNLLMCLMVFLVLLLCTLLLFQTRSIYVTGTRYSSELDVLEWINEDEYAINSLYIWLRYHGKETDLPPAIESVQVALRSPWSVELQVTEKSMVGYIEYREARIYFDYNGIVSLITEQDIDGVPRIDEMDVDFEKIRLNEQLPVANGNIFRKIAEVSELLTLHELEPDRITGPDGNITLYFGGILVHLGNHNFADRLAQIPPILIRLEEQYPGQSGTLHLENFERTDNVIRFVPAEGS